MAAMTTEQFLALSGGEQDAAVARALGWTYNPNRTWEWQKALSNAACKASSSGQPPPYATGGDADPFARWDLLAEVWRALRCTPCATPTLVDWNTRWYYRDDPKAAEAYIHGEGATPHRAACLALVAAGLVEGEDHA